MALYVSTDYGQTWVLFQSGFSLDSSYYSLKTALEKAGYAVMGLRADEEVKFLREGQCQGSN
jgi:hypothetical protein